MSMFRRWRPLLWKMSSSSTLLRKGERQALQEEKLGAVVEEGRLEAAVVKGISMTVVEQGRILTTVAESVTRCLGEHDAWKLMVIDWREVPYLMLEDRRSLL